MLAAAVLASSRDSADGVGDPVEQALVLAAAARGLAPDELRDARRLVDELPFDSARKRMTVIYEEEGRRRAYMKGAPEVVADRMERWANAAGRDNVLFGNDCGFCSTAGNTEIPESVAWAKLKALADGARIASGRLWE